MTLLILLAVINGYVVIPWWAWLAGWLNTMWSLAVFAAATRAEYKKYQLTKKSATFIKDMMEKIQTAAPSQVPMGPLYGSDDSPMN